MTRYIGRIVFASICLLILVVVVNSRRDMLQRDEEYWRLRNIFRMAKVIAPMSKHDNYGVREFWNAPLTLSDGSTVTVKIDKVMNGNAVVAYPDGSEKSIRPHADYTHHLCVAVDGDDLYLLRSISLFDTQYRLVRFDLRNGAIAVDRRVDGGDDFCETP
jgi:hypothetical protein